MKNLINDILIKSIKDTKEGIFVVDNNGLIIYVNDYVLSYLGYSFEEITKKYVWQIDPMRDTQDSFEDIRDNKKLEFRTFHLHKNSTQIPVEVSATSHEIQNSTYMVAYVKEISEKLDQEYKLELFHDMLDNSHDMIFIIRLNDGHVDYVNQTAIETLGYSFDEINALGIESIRKPIKENETFLQHLEELKKVGKLVDYAIVRKKDGSEIYVEANVKLLKKDGFDYNIAIVRDITARFELENQLKESNKNLEHAVEEKTTELLKNIAYLKSYKLAMDESSIVSRADLYGNITYVNDKFCEISGYTEDEALGKPHSIIRHPESSSEMFKELWQTIQSKKVWKGILQNRGKKQDYWIDVSILPILDESDEIIEYIAVRHDITKIIEQKKALDEIVNRDILTGFANRYKLNSDIKNSTNPALAVINIDNFSQVNDFYGHEIGDEIIKKLGFEISKTMCVDCCTLYHLQGDEYVIFNPDIEKNYFISVVKDVVEKISQASLAVYDEALILNFTTAVSFESWDKILTTADMALRIARKNDIDFLLYSDEISLNSEYENNIKWTKKIKYALENDNIIPVFQPIISNFGKEREKYEALVRLEDEGRLISPYFFLEISKKTKHYSLITKTMIKKTFETFKDKDVEFSINLTIQDILNAQIKEYIFEMIQSYDIGERVVFEIVESESIQNFQDVIAFINEVRRFGCKIAIDDFGTGYSNFEYLLKIKADYIKIDGSMIKNIDKDTDAQIVVATIVDFAKKMGVKTVAEFVENEAIYNKVVELGVDYSQGYYFCAPKDLRER